MMELIAQPISHTQRKRIFAIAKEIGMLKEKLDEFCEANGVSSLRSEECTSAESEKLIRALNELKKKLAPAKPEPTNKQLNAIRAIAGSLRMSRESLERFIQRQVGHPNIYLLNPGQASKVIAGLKAIERSKKK